jgi:excisionase family DNA binding protein
MAMTTINGDFHSVPEAAKILGLSVNSVYQYLSDGVIKGIKFGPARMISQQACEEFERNRKPRGNPNLQPKKKKRKK